MNMKKIMSIIWTLAIVASIMPVTTATTPNFDEWGNAVDELFYDEINHVDVEIDTSNMPNDTYYVLYPIYAENDISWDQLKDGSNSDVSLVVDGDDTVTIEDIALNISGLWVLSSSGAYDGLTHPGYYFWVNGTEYFTIDLTNDEVTFGDDENITITVTKGNGSEAACWIDIYHENGNQILHEYRSDGILDSIDWTISELEWVGEYIVHAYRDVDDQFVHPYISCYNSEYDGNKSYNYTNCGSWDPPEHVSEKKTITMNTGEPKVTFYDDDVYWSFDGEINISVDVENLNVIVLNDDYENITSYLDINISGKDIIISNSDNETAATGGWGRDALGNIYGENGTWRAYLFNDTNCDGIEEWNTTARFKVLSPVPIQWEWMDDDGATSNNNKDSVIPRIPNINEIPLNIQFQIIGNDHSFYGDLSSNPVEDYGKNITLTGDALFLSTETLDDFVGVSYLNGMWTVPIIPTMSVKGGKISFHVEWEGYGSLEQDLLIGGSEYNGSIVEITPNTFVIDEELTVSVNVFGPLGTEYPISNADVELWWLNDDGTKDIKINETDRPDDPGTNTYSFVVTKNDQHDGLATLPRELMAYVNVVNIGCGYAAATMMPMSDLHVSVSQDTIMAGEKTVFDIIVTHENNSEPEGNIQVEFYDADGEKVDLNSDFGSLRDSDLDGAENNLDDYILIPGVYTLYAYNATHDSTGHNATLEVKAVDVSCNLSIFIWNIDDKESAEFTVLYNRNNVNGTLKVLNMSDEGDYYSVWVENGETQFNVINGTATIVVSADYLPNDKFLENLTFEFSPDSQGSKFAEANGVIPVKVADVSVFPNALPFNVVANLEITVTGRNVGLANVLVGIDVPGIPTTLETNTDENGKAKFAFEAPTTGKIIITIENRTSDKTVLVTAWSLYIDAPIQVNEKEVFTIYVRNGSINGEEITSAVVEFAGHTEVSEYTFTAPSVSSDIEYTMKATLEGHVSASVKIMVTNVPVLFVIVENVNITIDTSGKTFTVTIANDEGSAIIGATVIFNGKEYISSAGGVAVLDVPEEEGNYEIIAHKDGFESSSVVSITAIKQDTPGFEVIVFIASLCIAFILLRKRR